ncbi:TLD family protein [Spironucleus salmonicida]|uniref:TLD family protein n=1 Tax=Spironucleus salmonicida TaxID=348837 RepID=V6LYQ8_9EUKA|nr:TLD family protein [Spironucleus salmonicida]|eukprot:EST49403.1 TLD family protein [Spironucleus salmonicida]
MKKQEIKTILPGISNLSIPAIRLVNKSIAFGKLRVGGSVLVFSSLQSQVNLQVLLPLESIEKIAFRKIQIDHLLLLRRATVRYQIDENKEYFILRGAGQKTKYYDPSIFKEFLQDPIQVMKELQGLFYENTIDIITYNGEKFIFSSTCQNIVTIYQEIILFIVKYNEIDKDNLIIETSGTEDFEYHVFSKPYNIDKTVQQLTQTNTQPQLLFKRQSYKLNKKAHIKNVSKLSASEQIMLLSQHNTRQIKRKTNSKKYDKKSACNFTNKYEYLESFNRTGNLSGQKLPADILSEYLYEIVSDDDIQFSVKQFIPKSDQINLSFDMCQASSNGHENSQDLVVGSIYNLLNATQGFDIDCSEYSNQINYFVDRESKIFAQDELEVIFNNIPSEFSQMKIFIQYQCSQDGRYLQNIYESFKKSEVGILSWVVDQFQERLQILPDHLAPNWMLIFRSKLQKFGCFFSEFKLNTQFSQKQLICFSNINGELNFFESTQDAKIFAHSSPHSLTIGGKGPAIHVVKQLREVQSAYCDTFSSPPLFQGESIGGYETIELDEIEVWRFVL